MLRVVIAIAFAMISCHASAWSSPKEAVERFAAFDFNGGRLDSWDEYETNYTYMPDDYDEPGWDAVVVVEKFSVGEPVCSARRCAVPVTYQLVPTKSLNDRYAVSHESGGSEVLTFDVIEKHGVWKIDPSPIQPRVSLEIYNNF